MSDELPDISTLSRVPQFAIDMAESIDQSIVADVIANAYGDGVCFLSVRSYENGELKVRHIEKKEIFQMTEDMFEDHIEAEIKQKGLDAPRISKEHIDNLMSRVQYTVTYPLPTTTLVLATLDGFHLATGFSACVSVENFDPELGAKIASRDAVELARNELWKLEGYRLARSLIEGVKTPE